MITGLILAAQVALGPCAIEGVRPPAHCGIYRVSEDRGIEQGRQLDLSIIVLDAFGAAKKADPMFFLSGGPGDAPSFNARFFGRVFEGIRQTRDLVLVDLRGTGKSAALTCPELARPGNGGAYDQDMMNMAAIRACRARLEQRADLRFYTTELAVDDLEEVRQAMGYAQINLYGTSYGSRVAQVYMRRHPSSLRAVTMKGIVPPSMASPESHASSGDLAWRSLVTRCRQDANCARTFPTLDADFHALLDRLERTSPAITLPAADNRSAASITVTRGLFAESFRNLLYSPEASAQAPKLIRALLAGDDRGLAETAFASRTLLASDRLAAGFFLSVTCTEDAPYLPASAPARAAGTFGGDYRLQQQAAACAAWPRGEVSAQHRQPTRSNIPTLILSGEFDPVTPPSGGEEVMQGLTRGVHVVIRNNGHPIGSAEQCVARLIGAFIDKGSADGLDRSCASAIPSVPFLLSGGSK